MALKDPKIKLSCFLWLTFTIIICIIVFNNPYHHSVSINYWLAANHWLNGEPLYDNSGRGFIYLTQSAILYIPLAILPFPISEIIWRILSLGIFSYGLFYFSILVAENNTSKKINTRLCLQFAKPPQKHEVFEQRSTKNSGFMQGIVELSTDPGFCFLVMSLITIPMAFSSARNGQMHLFMTGILMLAMNHLSKSNWLKVSILLIFSAALKPTAIVLLLLTAGLFSKTRMYLLIGVIFFLLLGFLTQSPHYVMNQYMASIYSLQETAQLGTKENWAQLFSLIAQFGMPIPDNIQTILRLIMAFLVLILGYSIRKRCTITQTALWLFTLSMCYLMLFNPRTEGNDYIMLAPAIGFVLIDMLAKKKFYAGSLLVLLVGGFLNSYYIGKTITPENTTWIDPLLGLIFFVVVIFCVLNLISNKSNASSKIT